MNAPSRALYDNEDVSFSDASDDAELRSTISRSASHLNDAVSTVYPHDSISMRGLVASQEKRHHAPSEASETPSLVSFHSFAGGPLFKTVHGREFNNQSDLYMLPADDDEHARLNIQHVALRLHLGSLYASKHLVETALQLSTQPRPAVLDVGTGSGRWVVDMALQFPHADVVGLDIVPPALLTDADVPENCRFEVDDANLSLAHYEGAFNVVHMRAAHLGINDFESWLYEIARTLRPNGILLLATGIPQMYDAKCQPLPTTQPGEEGFTWLQYVWSATYTALHNRGNFSVDSCLYWQRWLESNPNYRDPRTRSMFIPLGPWKPDMSQRETYIANLMREDCIRILRNQKPLLLVDGAEEIDVDLWIGNVMKELKDLTIHSNSRWQYSVAVRNTRPWQERLEEPQPLESGGESLLGSGSDVTSGPEGVSNM